MKTAYLLATVLLSSLLLNACSSAPEQAQPHDNSMEKQQQRDKAFRELENS